MLKAIVSMAVAAVLLMAAPAHAETAIWILAMDGESDLVLALGDDEETAVRVDVVRGGTTIAASDEGAVELADLHAGDVVNTYEGAITTSTTTYDGLPSLTAPVCVGQTTFTGRRSPNATIAMGGSVGALVGDTPPATWTPDEAFTLTLPQPVASDDGVFVATSWTAGDVTVLSMRAAMATMCPGSPQPPADEPPAQGPDLGRLPGLPVATDLRTPLGASLSGLRSTSLRALARRTSKAVSFEFPAPGTVSLRLTARGKLVASGTRTLAQAGNGRVTLKLTRAGRRLLARSAKLKLTLHATFKPAAAGAEPRRADASITLRRR